ncbi:hypothetical protein C5167_046397 [Papaver somniferum]|uniref:Uncharacterized protein n=1 Tax=Papaver somniferum TaxID=3469 RepID=A0A4Y7LF88_PAPSO|nr:hypothetical protein C5167_046397 [Papaver somniferum]
MIPVGDFFATPSSPPPLSSPLAYADTDLVIRMQASWHFPRFAPALRSGYPRTLLGL